MINYKTSQEKATEWNVSVRYIQNLCKKGEIEGAVKRVGAWFIPDDTPMPTKNTKSGAQHFHFTGTKKKVFDSSIKLFTLHGYDGVSIRDIADSVGITQSSMYNHFSSKQEILDTIYDYYCYYHQKNKPSMEEIESILRNGSLLDIVKSVWYTFDPEYINNLLDISKIIMQRNSIDERAREIAQSILVDSGMEFVEAVFSRAVEIGRLAPMDTYTMAFFVNCVKTFTLHLWMLDPSAETTNKITENEMQLYQYATMLLTDLNPPAK